MDQDTRDTAAAVLMNYQEQQTHVAESWQKIIKNI